MSFNLDDMDEAKRQEILRRYEEDGRLPVEIILENPGSNKTRVMSVVRKLTDARLEEARYLVEHCPYSFVYTCNAEEISEALYDLDEAGASGRCPMMNATFGGGIMVGDEKMSPRHPAAATASTASTAPSGSSCRSASATSATARNSGTSATARSSGTAAASGASRSTARSARPARPATPYTPPADSVAFRRYVTLAFGGILALFSAYSLFNGITAGADCNYPLMLVLGIMGTLLLITGFK